MIRVFGLVLLLGANITYGQNILHDLNKEEYIGICISLLDIPEMVKKQHLCAFQGDSILFILLNFEDSITYGNGIGTSISVNDQIINLWYMQSLFFSNIPYWVQFQSIINDAGLVYAEVISVNSVDNDPIRPTFRLSLTMNKDNAGYRILRYNYEEIN